MFNCTPVYASRDMVIPTVCVSMCASKTLSMWTHNSLNRLTLTFNHGCNSYLGWWSYAQDQLVWPWLFLDLSLGHENLILLAHCTMNGGHFVDPIAHLTIWVWPSIMVSPVSWDEEVVHKTCCFDFDIFLTFLQGYNKLRFVCTVWLWPSIMVSKDSWDDEVVDKTCCCDLVWPFHDLFARSHKLIMFCTLYHERGSVCEYHNSLNSLTLTFNHGLNS